MARGDVIRKSGRGGGRWGGGSSYDYDDEGRGGSKQIWEWFSENWESNGYTKDWLFNRSDDECYRLITKSTLRFGIEDIAIQSTPNIDSRAKRLVEKKQTKQTWLDFHKFMVDGYLREQDAQEQRRKDRDEENRKRWEAIEQAREAEALKVALDDVARSGKEIELALGAIRSDFVDAFRVEERYYQPEGDWLDDPVEGIRTGYGFGEEVKERSSIKLQITLSLDMSNSMYYNSVHQVAAHAFREIGLALLSLKEEFENDMFINFFKFSLDNYDKRGTKVEELTDPTYEYRWDWAMSKRRPVQKIPDSAWDKESHAVVYKQFRHFGAEFQPRVIESWYGYGPFNGTMTRIAPLFEAIEEWEKDNSDPGAVRLDLLITDAVLESPGDIRTASAIQERRNGNLQTVLLNFMPEEEWVNSTLPLRCVQYAVNAKTISGMLRQIIAEFIGAQL